MNLTEHWPLLGGVAAVLLALCAWLADYRRVRRQDLDRVGIVPWTELFFWSTMAALLLLGAAGKAWLAA